MPITTTLKCALGYKLLAHSVYFLYRCCSGYFYFLFVVLLVSFMHCAVI